MPALAAGIEKHHNAAANGVAAAQVARLGKVAVMARPGERPRVVRAAVLPGQDVLDVKGEQRQVIFMETAILAALLGAQAHQRADRFLHTGWR